jgi:hypothetical protein
MVVVIVVACVDRLDGRPQNSAACARIMIVPHDRAKDGRESRGTEVQNRGDMTPAQLRSVTTSDIVARADEKLCRFCRSRSVDNSDLCQHNTV